MYPNVRTKSNESNVILSNFKGLNRLRNANDGDIVDGVNLSSDVFPTISIRPNRNDEGVTFTNPISCGLSGENKKWWVDGTTFYYDGVAKTGSVTASNKSVVDYAGKLIIFPDKKVFDYKNSATALTALDNTYISGTSQITFNNASVDIANGSQVTFTSDRITLTTGYWPTTFVAGTVITIDGCVSFYNNNKQAKIVERVSSTVLRFDTDTFTNGIEASTISLNFSFSNIVTTGASFSGFNISDYIQVTGCTGKKENNKYATIIGVSTNVLSFEPSTFLSSAETPAITIKVPIPDIDYAVALDGRIWGVGDKTIFASRYGYYNNFLETGTDDYLSWNVSIESNGDFIGIKAYSGHVIAFKATTGYKIFGKNSTEFNYIEMTAIDFIDNRSLIEINKVLYWVGHAGLYAYTGMIDGPLTIQLNEKFVNAVCGTDGRKLYMSLYNGTSWKLYVMDGNQWLPEDSSQVVGFINQNGYLYGLHYDTKKLWKYNYGTETISSSITFAKMFYGLMRQKKHLNVAFMVELEAGASISVYESLDEGDWTLQKTFDTVGRKRFNMKPYSKSIDIYQLKIVGTGRYYIYAINPEFTVADGRD